MIYKLNSLQIPSSNKYSLIKDGITQGMLGTFTFCRVAFLIRLNKLKKSGKERNTSQGTIFHEFLENYFTFIKKGGTLPLEVETKRIVTKVLAKHSEKALSVISEEEMERIQINTLALAKGYVTQWGKADLKKIIVKPELEFNFLHVSSTTKNSECRRRGKVDLVFSEGDGTHAIMEHKVKGRIDTEGIQRKLAIDFQSLYYCSSLELLFQRPCRKVIYDVIRNPGGGKKLRTGYRQYIEKEIAKEPKHFFIRFPNTFTAKEIADTNMSIAVRVTEIQRILNGELPIYRNENSCFNHAYYCEHLDACASGTLVGYNKGETYFPELTEEKGELV